jgi:hypothetical protein
LALCWATCFSSVSNAQQIDTTGNLINNNNWSGAVYGADPGGCCASISGSGALYDTTTDTIMFSYGTSTLTQTIGINQALGGTGIKVHGYNYGWDFRYMSNNGNNNDTLSFNISLRDSSGTVVESQTLSWDNAMQMNIFNYDTWYTVSNSRTFNNPYLDPQSISLSMTGRDGGYWAGYYGPEVRNVSLSLNYSFDPCTADPLYSSSCPGYMDAFFAKIGMFFFGSPETTTVSTPTVETTPVVTATSEPEQTQEVVTAPVVVSQPVTQATTETAPAATVASTPAATESQSSGGSRVSLSTILNIVGNEQSRIAGVERSTVEQSVEQSVKEGEKATQQAESIAASATSESISVSISSAQSQMALDQQQANLSGQSSGGGLNFFSSASGSLSLSDSSVGLKPPEPTMTEQLATIQTEERTESAVSFSGFSAVNVLKEEETKTDSGMQTEQKTETVKRNVPNNELAGNVTLASLGATPQGYQAYSTMMPDAAFYAPKEIYKNQVVVDNRAGRRMFGGSDALHQQMVDQQYK